MITDTHSNLISPLHHHTNSYHNKKEACALVHKIRNQDRAMLEGTEREAKERQGQNWPSKKVLPNFPMNIKVAPFIFIIIDNQAK